jgi:hypothetical protein
MLRGIGFALVALGIGLVVYAKQQTTMQQTRPVPNSPRVVVWDSRYKTTMMIGIGLGAVGAFCLGVKRKSN